MTDPVESLPYLDPGVARSTFVGAACEMTVAADLMRRGIAVYRACAPVAECDLLAVFEDGSIKRIEVRSARRNGSGILRCTRPPRGRWDVLAMVEPSGQVTYSPPLSADERLFTTVDDRAQCA